MHASNDNDKRTKLQAEMRRVWQMSSPIPVQVWHPLDPSEYIIKVQI